MKLITKEIKVSNSRIKSRYTVEMLKDLNDFIPMDDIIKIVEHEALMSLRMEKIKKILNRNENSINN